MPVTKRQVADITKDYIAQAIVLEQEVQRLLDKWQEANETVIKAHSSSSGVRNMQQMTKELLELVTKYLEDYGIVMDKGIGKISHIKAMNALEESLPLLRSIGDTMGAEYFKKDMESFSGFFAGVWATIGTGLYGVTFKQRQAAIELSTKKTINNILVVANKEGLGGADIEKIMKDYVNPNTNPEKPWDIARKATGASKKYIPKDVLSGSVQTNLYETTRNQSSELWRDMTEKVYDNADWVSGYDWTLSSSHPVKDICDELAANSPYDKGRKRPYSHGHCMCDWVAHLRSREELKDILKNKGMLYNSRYSK